MPGSALQRGPWESESLEEGAERPESAPTLLPVGAPGGPGEVPVGEPSSRDREIETFLVTAEEARTEALRSLARGVAHQLNNLLHGLLIHVDLIKRQLDRDSPAHQSLEQLLRSTEQGSEFVRQLLCFAGVEAGPVELCDVSRLVEALAVRLLSRCSAEVQLKLDLAEGLPRVWGQGARLERVILALFDNALAAFKGGRGTISIRAGAAVFTRRELSNALPRANVRGGRYVYFEIEDDGVGMDSALSSRVFEPFAVNKYTGKGLGLPLVLGAMYAWGGLVDLNSEPKRGTRVRLLWPLTGDLGLPPAAERRDRAPY